MPVIDELLENSRRYSESFDKADLPAPPSRHIAIVTCMDARIDTYAALGLSEGEAHVIRNAGGVVTSDVIRSLTISQRMLGTREIMVIHHTGCGMMSFRDDEFREAIRADTGIRPDWAAEAFSDVDDDVRQSVARIMASPFVPEKGAVRGFVYDVKSGGLREVPA